MKQLDHCPVCGGQHFVQNVDTVISAFVVERMRGEDRSGKVNYPTKSIQCGTCHFIGTLTRFERDEETRYYKNYMKDDYNNHRTLYEGTDWLMYQNYFDTQEYFNIRKQAAVETLSEVLDLSAISSMLDYGGNTGYTIPDELNHSNRFLLDVEARTLANGVVAVTSLKESGQVDLVMCSHTMEHVSYPTKLLEDIKRYIKPGGYLYIEVPQEQPGFNVHEHINYVMYPFLEKLLVDNGFKILIANSIDYEQPMVVSMSIVGQLL
jgi:SAM-dependent methyltransferase